MSDINKVGAVMVVGAGIGGCQAALDLADSGFKVYLIERNPSIGGTMAQLDKTFPTNDCSMCILAPKLVGVGRHPNIELITNADIINLEGKPGNFNATINKRARFIFEDKCTGCVECIQQCPVNVPDEFNEKLNDRKAIYLQFPQAVPLKVLIEKRGIPPCKNACPAHVNAQGYVALISNRNYLEAVNLIRERCPLPSVIGRICPHPCETACNREELEEAINICGLKRFVADYVRDNIEEKIEFLEDKKEERVAIIGSGPSGLTVAYHLARRGYSVTIFEKEQVIGGMLRLGIPDYRLPPEILNADIEHIKRYGVEIKTNTPIGPPGLTIRDLLKDYKAVYIGVGLPNNRSLNIEGEDLENVIPAIAFLKSCNLGKEVTVGKRVLVIGGGDVAFDAGRTALRKGAEEVHLIMLESEDIIPAHPWEVEEAKEEGITIHMSRGPKRFIGEDGKVIGVETLFCSSVFDEDGQFNPVLSPGTEELIEGDMVIVAIGQTSDLTFLDNEIKVDRGIKIDKNNFQTSMHGVFAGGEIVTGPGSAIDAIATGNKAAIVIERYLKGEDILKVTETIPDYNEDDVVTIDDIDDVERFHLQPRKNNILISPRKRKKDFKEFTMGMDENTALEEAKRCLNCGICSECLECVRACLADAINHEQTDETVSINIGSVILSPGFDEYIPEIGNLYGYGKYPNVITSIEFERILSASGPFTGEIIRPSDNKVPKKILWLNCIGSRNTKIKHGYCSAVCCMYTIKEAVITKEHNPDIDCHINFIDMRTVGKGFEEYYLRAQELGIKFVRGRTALINEDSITKNLIVSYENTLTGEVGEEIFDMVILSVGLQPSIHAIELSKRLGINLNKYDFCSTNLFTPLETNKPGVFVCGAFSGPKDIPETVAEASGAAGKASTMLSDARNTLTTIKEYPPELLVEDQEPRIGVFICNCGINIGGVVNVPEVVEFAKTLPNVAYTEENLYTCSQDTQDKIKQKIDEHKLNRIVVASCTPRTHEPLFQNTIREAGLNPYLFELANIREHCSWVHMSEHEKATEKAKDLVAMYVSKAKLLEPIYETSVDVTHSGLVIGGGIAGMNAALELANQGYEVYLIEKEGELGGLVRNIHYVLEGGDPQEYLKNLINQIKSHEKVKTFTSANIEDVQGFVGNFLITVNQNGEKKQLETGVIIVATGGTEYKPKEYLYGNDKRILTQLELEQKIIENEVNAETIVMIQCVGSRNEERPNCHRICCSLAIKNALKLKEKNPKINICILYRDIRTYGFKEDYYREAREKGIIFIRFDKDFEPNVDSIDNDLMVTVNDSLLNEQIVLKPDLIVLSAAFLPAENKELSQMLKVPLEQNGFFLEAHVKLRPLDFATDGIFLCGAAQWPKFINESIAQAKGAAARAGTILSKDKMKIIGSIAEIEENKCIGCGECRDMCIFDAIDIIETEIEFKAIRDSVDPSVSLTRYKSRVLPAICKGCGSCVGVCPVGAISLKHFTNQQLIAMIESYLGEEGV